MLLVMAAPTRASKRLGEFLLNLRSREGVNFTLRDAAAELRVRDSSVSRFESGQIVPNWPAVQSLLRLYDATDDELAKVSQLWEQAKNGPKPVRLPSEAPIAFRRLVNEEREAQGIRCLSMTVITGYFQREEYAKAIIAAGRTFSSNPVRVPSRLSRQQLLAPPFSLPVHALLDEAVITRVVGNPQIMADQLRHLLTLGEQHNITMQVVPFGAGAYGTMSGACTIVDYPEGEGSGVYLEYPAGGVWVEAKPDVDCFTAMFDDVSGRLSPVEDDETSWPAALDPSESADLIRSKIRTLDGNSKPAEVAKE
jgi:transcriptional regulator with XRE-family HTH domain